MASNTEIVSIWWRHHASHAVDEPTNENQWTAERSLYHSTIGGGWLQSAVSDGTLWYGDIAISLCCTQSTAEILEISSVIWMTSSDPEMWWYGITDILRNLEVNISNADPYSARVPADGLAPFGAEASADTVMADFGTCIYTGRHLMGQDSCDIAIKDSRFKIQEFINRFLGHRPKSNVELAGWLLMAWRLIGVVAFAACLVPGGNRRISGIH